MISTIFILWMGGFIYALVSTMAASRHAPEITQGSSTVQLVFAALIWPLVLGVAVLGPVDKGGDE